MSYILELQSRWATVHVCTVYNCIYNYLCLDHHQSCHPVIIGCAPLSHYTCTCMLFHATVNTVIQFTSLKLAASAPLPDHSHKSHPSTVSWSTISVTSSWTWYCTSWQIMYHHIQYVLPFTPVQAVLAIIHPCGLSPVFVSRHHHWWLMHHPLQ